MTELDSRGFINETINTFATQIELRFKNTCDLRIANDLYSKFINKDWVTLFSEEIGKAKDHEAMKRFIMARVKAKQSILKAVITTANRMIPGTVNTSVAGRIWLEVTEKLQHDGTLPTGKTLSELADHAVHEADMIASHCDNFIKDLPKQDWFARRSISVGSLGANAFQEGAEAVFDASRQAGRTVVTRVGKYALPALGAYFLYEDVFGVSTFLADTAYHSVGVDSGYQSDEAIAEQLASAQVWYWQVQDAAREGRQRIFAQHAGNEMLAWDIDGNELREWNQMLNSAKHSYDLAQEIWNQRSQAILARPPEPKAPSLESNGSKWMFDDLLPTPKPLVIGGKNSDLY